MSSFIKQQLSREAIDESIDTTGVMESVLSAVDSTSSEATNQINETTADEIDDVGNDIEAAQGYVDVLEQSPPEGASEEALAVAQVGLEAIFNKYGVPMKAVIARESADYSARVATFETIAMANEGIAEMVKSFAESCGNVIERMQVNMKDTFRRRAAWLKEANILRSQLNNASGAPREGAKYTNRIRVAHMTLGNQTVLTSGKDMLSAVDTVEVSMNGLVGLLDGIGSLFTWFNKQKGKVDFTHCTSNFEPSQFTRGVLSLSGSAALFGEETVINQITGSSENADEMMNIASKINIKHTYVWKVKDLQQPELPPLSIEEMKQGIEDLAKTGQVICNLYNRYDQEVVKYVQEMMNKNNPERFDSDMITSPIRYFRFNRIYKRVMMACIASINNGFDLNFKAATCLLEYWKWSVANNK